MTDTAANPTTAIDTTDWTDEALDRLYEAVLNAYDPSNPDDCPRGIRGHIDDGDGFCHLCDRDLVEAE